LNAVTKRTIYPIPATQQLLDNLSGSLYFSTLDLSQGYHQIAMDPTDIPKTAFTTRRGQFEYKRMPFGLSTAPATFQRLMHIVFKQENWEKCLIYLDDVLIFGRSADEHLERLKAILQRIREAGLKLSPKKCFFMQKQVEYLGHIVSAQGIKTDSKKVEKVKTWPVPKTVKEVKSFLGFCGYYRRFIKNFAEIARPLEALCAHGDQSEGKRKKTVDISGKWQEQHDISFIELKNALTNTPVLAFPNNNDMFVLDTDASNTGIGAVLSQIQMGQERVIAYGSRKMTKAERRYCTTRKELLAVHYFVRHFKHYLYGRRFQVRTDHKALLWMLNWRKPNTSQYCLWKAELEMYDMDIMYRPGTLHVNADALSRIPQCHQCELKHTNPVTKRNYKVHSESSSATCSEVASSMPVVVNMLSHHADTSQYNYYEDSDLKIILELMRSGNINCSSMPVECKFGNSRLKELWRRRDQFRLRGDALYLLDKEKYRIVVPKQDMKQVIDTMHSSLGHVGVNKLCYVLKDHYYWPKMEEEIILGVNQCFFCQRAKLKKAKECAPLQSTVVGEPFERIAIDISGPYRPSKHGHRYILAIIDYFSKFPVLIPLRRVDANTVARKVLHHWIVFFGAPNVIHSDRGTNFESELFHEQCRIFGIDKTRTSPYYPQADGLVERLFRTIKPLISATVKKQGISWCEALPIVEMGLRCTLQSSTGFSPFEVIFGRRMRLPIIWQTLGVSSVKNYTSYSHYICELQEHLEQVRSNVEVNLRRAIQRQSYYYNKNKTCQPIQVGDMVLVKVEKTAGIFPMDKYQGPYKVVTVKNEWSFVLQDLQTGKRIVRNYNQVKPIKWSEKQRQINRPDEDKSRLTSIESRSTHQQQSRNGNHAMPVDGSRRYPARDRGAPHRLGFTIR
jgi:transposase InsO family protein